MTFLLMMDDIKICNTDKKNYRKQKNRRLKTIVGVYNIEVI